MKYIIEDKRNIILIAVFLFSFIIRYYILYIHWVNPDEGAHLMDSFLVLEGKIPGVDFNARQPLYVYVNTLIFYMFGVSLEIGRHVPLFFSMCNSILVYYIAKYAFNKNTGVVAATIYLLLPLEIYDSVIVKTESLNTTLITSSILLLILALDHKSSKLYFLSGFIAALSYYVRKSSIILLFVGCILFIYLIITKQKVKMKQFKNFWYGYLSVVTIIFILCLTFFDYGLLLKNGFSPFAFIFQGFQNIVKAVITSVNLTPVNEASIHGNENFYKIDLYLMYIKMAIYLHVFLFVGMLFSFVEGFKSLFQEDSNMSHERFFLLILWLASLFLAYGYYFFERGFFIHYFREFLPPMVILTSYWMVKLFERSRTQNSFNNIRFCLFICACVVLFLFQQYVYILSKSAIMFVALSIACIYIILDIYDISKSIKYTFYIVFAIFVFCVTYLIQNEQLIIVSRYITYITLLFSCVIFILLKIKFYNWRYLLKGIKYSIFLSMILVSITYSSSILDHTFDCPYSMKSINNIENILKKKTTISDQVMSGAVVWELSANRKPFMNISHPLSFQKNISKDMKNKVKNNFLNDPPKAIIEDGYTAKTYFKHFDWMTNYINTYYDKHYIDTLSRHIIILYLLK